MTVQNTTPVQIQSVVNFMNVLGYTLDRTRANGSFINVVQSHRAANRHISFRTATKLHNGKPEDWSIVAEGRLAVLNMPGVELNTGFNPLSVLLAYASKLVEKNKIHFDRHGNAIANAEGVFLVKPLNRLVSEMVGAV